MPDRGNSQPQIPYLLFLISERVATTDIPTEYHMKKTIILILTLLTAIGSRAQYLSGAYFLEGMQQRSEMNPAFAPEWNYFTAPGLGGAGVSFRGNAGLKQFIFPRTIDGRKTDVTWMHPSVSLNDLRFEERYKLSEDLRLPLLGVGFRGLKGFNTIGLNLRQSLSAAIPGELLTVVKQLRNQDYHIGDLNVSGMAWGELAFGHSHKIGRDLRIGGKVKLLLGMARLEAQVSNLSLQMASTDEWRVTGKATMEVNLTQFSWGTTTPKLYNGQTHSVIAFKQLDAGFGITGVGLGFDLGAQYDLHSLAPGLKVSAAVTDLGFVGWGRARLAQNISSEDDITGFHHVKIGTGSGQTIREQIEVMRDNLVQVVSLEDKGTTPGRTTMLGATVNVGLDYRLPMLPQLQLGLLSTTRIAGQHTWNEERLSVGFTPLRWLEVGVSGGVGSYGASFGWLLNFKPKVVNAFIGMDHTFDKVARPFVPLTNNGDLYCGINFTW